MNLSIWDIMAPAFFECLILVGIHSYLGLHVLRRKVIFVDLALAQIAALGTTVGFLFGIMPGTSGAYVFSLLFTFIGAAVFSISRFRNEKIPQEAIIGLTYAIAAAVAILVIDKAPHGAEHIKEILTGSILWVKWDTIVSAGIVYSLIGIFHFIFRKKFILISENPDAAYKQGLNIRFWDFLFYMSFGIVITHSVGTAGVLLVFVFLVVPAIGSMMITDILWKQLVFGWAMGLFVSVTGLYISYQADLPSGPTVVAFYGVTLTLTAIALYLWKSKERKTALIKTGIGIGTSIAIIFGFMLLGNVLRSTDNQAHNESEQNEEHKSTEVNKQVAYEDMTEDELSATLKNVYDVSEMVKIYNAQNDAYNRTTVAAVIARKDKKKGLKLLLQIVTSNAPPFAKYEAIDKMRRISGQNFGYDSDKTDSENAVAIIKWKEWITAL